MANDITSQPPIAKKAWSFKDKFEGGCMLLYAQLDANIINLTITGSLSLQIAISTEMASGLYW